MKNVQRYFYKCRDCSATVATTQKYNHGKCGFCGGMSEFMGQVKQDMTITTEERCACDARCTNAAGPICNCHCGGENHGSKKTITVIRLIDGIPVFTPNEGSKEESLRIVKEVNSLLQEYKNLFKTKYPQILADKAAGKWLIGAAWGRFNTYSTTLDRVSKYRKPTSRLTLLRTQIRLLKEDNQ